MERVDKAEGGLRFGRYEIIKRIGSGGMAEIFLARAAGLPGFHKTVVVKRILPVLASKSDFLEMFLNEARIAATLQHPNLVQMYDVGVVDGNYFIAMEYLHGEDLRSIQGTLRQQGKVVPLEHTLQIAISVCAGLHYAHEKVGLDGQPLRIVHRDVSPQNVIVTYEGAVKLLDFGVAKLSTSPDTAAGVLKGNMAYMTPEQIEQRHPLDGRSDLFALGIVLYEMTLGRRLFATRSEFLTLKRILEMPVPRPRSVDPSYDPNLEEIVMRALARDRAHRYQTARQMQMDLESLARLRGMYLSMISLQQFMEQLFAHKRQAAESVRVELSAGGFEQPPPVEVTSLEATPTPMETPTPVVAPLSLSRRPGKKRRAVFLSVAVGAGLLALAVPRTLLRTISSQMRVARPAMTPPLQTVPPLSAPVTTLPAPPPVEPLGRPAPIGATGRRHRDHASKAGPSRAPAVGRGSLVVAATPWCEVTIDGVGVGPTPLTVELESGRHQLRLVNPDFQIDESANVVIHPQQTERKHFRFPTASAQLP